MRVLWLTLAVLALDQLTKTLVVLEMRLYESIPLVGGWFKLTYTTNPGMAFGLSFGPPGLVTAFALLATALIVVYLWRIRGAYAPYRYSLALILGGALGNIVDRIFYGVLYRYGGLFTGQVVDFVHFDIGRVMLPVLGERPLFPIFNVADMAIVAGVVGFMVFQGRFYRRLSAQRALLEAEADGPGAPVVTTSPEGPESR